MADNNDVLINVNMASADFDERQQLLPKKSALSTIDDKVKEALQAGYKPYTTRIKDWWIQHTYTQIAIDSISLAIPSFLSCGAILYFLLSYSSDKSANGITQGVFSTVFNYVQFFLLISATLTKSLNFYIKYFSDQAFRQSQPINRVAYRIFTDVVSYALGGVSCGLLPSLALEVSGVPQAFINFLIYALLYPASIAQLSAGLFDLLSKAYYQVLPPTGDAMYVNAAQIRVVEIFKDYLQKIHAEQAAKPAQDRNYLLADLAKQNISTYDRWYTTLPLQLLYFSLAMPMFLVSNLGNFKGAALSSLINMVEKVFAIAFGVVFGVFGASRFADLSAVLTLHPKILRNNLGLALASLILIGFSYFTASPSLVTFVNAFTDKKDADNNLVLPHKNNFSGDILPVLKGLVIAGTIYANGLWAVLFAIDKLGVRTDKYLHATEMQEKEFLNLDLSDQVDVVENYREQSKDFAVFADCKLKQYFPGCSPEQTLQQLKKSPAQAAAVKNVLDSHALVRNFSLAGSSVAFSMLNFSLLYSGFSVSAMLPGMAAMLAFNYAIHYYFDRKNQGECQPANSSHGFFNFSFNRDNALNFATRALMSTLPLAVAAASNVLIEQAAHWLFEMPKNECENAAQLWKVGLTTSATFVASQLAFKR